MTLALQASNVSYRNAGIVAVRFAGASEKKIFITYFYCTEVYCIHLKKKNLLCFSELMS